MKNIIICSDGTGNTAIKNRGTNVFKLYEAVDLRPPMGSGEAEQVAIYHDGVGTQKLKVIRLLAGAFGWGLGRNVRSLYTDLVRAYEPGDRIYLFGFSRGAFTVRTLAGFVDMCGILDLKRAGISNDAQLEDKVKRAYRLYRRGCRTIPGWIYDKLLRRREPGVAAEAWRGENAVSVDPQNPDQKVRIRFVGVWDTVDAVGFPIVGVAWFFNNFIYQFKFERQRMASIVDEGCHALAIDDERRSFHPLLWDVRDEGAGRVQQVWFAGAHSNVGGGYPKQGLSLVTLDWMMSRAEHAGLRFITEERGRYQRLRNAHDTLYDSRAGVATYYRYSPRDIRALCKKNGEQPKIHGSVFERIRYRTEGYAPGNLPAEFEIVGKPVPHHAALRKRLGDAKLLQAAAWPIRIRQTSQVSLLTLTVGLIGLVLWDRFTADGLGGVVAGAAGLVSPSGLMSALNAMEGQIIIGASIVAYLVGLFGRLRMEQRFSEFWFTANRGSSDSSGVG